MVLTAMKRTALVQRIELIEEQIGKLSDGSEHDWIRNRLLRLQAEFRRELEVIERAYIRARVRA